MWRSALEMAGFEIALVGEIEATDGKKREVDAGVRVGSTLFLMECRAIERPLDYEIGKPSVLARRNHLLEEKLVQAESLREFLNKNPHGKNYDVSWAENIYHYAISPFHEFIWTRDERFWEGEFPRIISADDMLEVLHSAKEGLAGTVSVSSI